jgi:hypothetical protein
MRYLVFAAALLFIGSFGMLTALYFANNGVTLVGIIGLGVLILVGVGIIGSLLHPPRR